MLQRSLHVEFRVVVVLSGYEADEEALAEDNEDIPRTGARPDEVPETMAVVALAGSSSPISSALRSSGLILYLFSLVLYSFSHIFIPIFYFSSVF